MKRIVVVLLLFVVGCGPVLMPSSYRAEVERQAIINEALAGLCDANSLEPEQACRALHQSAQTLWLVLGGIDDE